MKTKNTTTILAAASLLLGAPIAQSQQYDMSQVNQLVESLAKKRLLVPDNGLEVSIRKGTTEYKNLENICKADWSKIIDNLDSVVHRDDGRKLVISALQALPAADYMSALEKIVARFEEGKVDKPVLKKAICPTGRMTAFLEDNYSHPRVIALLNKVKAKTVEDANMTEYIDEILSGQAKTARDEFREDFAGTSFGNIPRIILP